MTSCHRRAVGVSLLLILDMRRLESQRGDLATKQDLQAATEPLKRDINWIKWIGGIGFTALLTVMIYLHSDTKAEMNKIDQRIDKLDQRIDKLESKIDLLLQRGQR